MRRRNVDDGQRAERGAVHGKTSLARDLRVRATKAEAALWQAVRARQLGVRFRRQHVLAGFIVDFYCPTCRLAIELDGDVHLVKREADAARTRALEAIGVTVLRFSNEDILDDRAGVLARLLDILARARPRLSCESPLLSPGSREKGEGSG